MSEMEVPKGWELEKLLDLTEIEYGKSLTRKELTNSGYPVFGANSIIGYYDKYSYDEEQVLISCRGTVGKINISPPKCFITHNSLIVKIKNPKILDKKFLFYSLQNISWNEIISGAVQSQITINKLTSVFLSLPDINLQKKIVKKLDHLFDIFEQKKKDIQSLNQHKSVQLPQLVKTYKKQILHESFSGFLTKNWRKNHAKINPKYTFDKIPDYLSSNQIEKTNTKLNISRNVLQEIPKSWKLVPSMNLFSYITSGSRGWAEYYSSSGALFFGVSNVQSLDIKLNMNKIRHVTLPKKIEGMRTKLQSGDILISITADIGRIGVVPKDIPESYINQHLALARSLDGIFPKYLGWFLQSPLASKQFKLHQRGATKMGLGLDDIRGIWIPVPSLEEQKEIVKTIEEKMKKLESSEFMKNLKSSSSIINKNLESIPQKILNSAFSGKLIS